MKIIIDTREQQPYVFEEVPSTRAALSAGDYSVEGFEAELAVERKSLADFAHTLTRGRKRFYREMKKLIDYRFACVVVEASLREVIDGNYSSGIAPQSLLGSALSVIVDYGVPVFFCCDRAAARLFTFKYLRRCYKTLEKEHGEQNDHD